MSLSTKEFGELQTPKMTASAVYGAYKAGRIKPAPKMDASGNLRIVNRARLLPKRKPGPKVYKA